MRGVKPDNSYNKKVFKRSFLHILMEKKGKYLLVAFVLVILANILWLFTFSLQQDMGFTAFISLKTFLFNVATGLGHLLLVVGDLNTQVIIASPLNQTYYFNIGDPDIETPVEMIDVLKNWDKKRN